MDLTFTTVLLFLVCAAVFLLIGWLIGRRRSDNKITGKRLEEYDFYPFVNNPNGHVEFNPDLFNKAVQHLLKERNPLAAGQLIVIGEQNLVRDTLPSTDLVNYKRLYQAYGGQDIISDNNQYLENYKRLVQLIGKSFPGTGIEILLHNLVNPSRSVVAIENGEVTGRKIENGTTNLVLDLKTRKMHNQDKLNYGLTIGARNFKCTTIPIFRPEYGLVGAVCINVDVNFLKDEVLSTQAKMVAFIEQMVKRDFELNEVILSKEEYQKALEGKRAPGRSPASAARYPLCGYRGLLFRHGQR
jgi:predicted transcriptional regulator YheO